MINKLIYVAVLGAAVILPGAFIFLLIWSYRKWQKKMAPKWYNEVDQCSSTTTSS